MVQKVVRKIKDRVRQHQRIVLDKLGQSLTRLGTAASEHARRVYQTEEEREVAERKEPEKQWYADKGDETLRVTYPLNETSIVFDVGGYHGDWAREIFSRYGSFIHIFEPVPEFATIIRKRFGTNPRIHLHQFGLSNITESLPIYMAEDGTSVIKKGPDSQMIELRDVVEFIREADITNIDLMKINIEGSEYDLLDRLIASGDIKKVADLQVQFHIFAPYAEERRAAIRNKLSETHTLIYDYPWVWENWRQKQ